LAVVHNAINAAVRLVAQVSQVGVALAGGEAGRRRVVLHDVVVPVDHPDAAVRADLRHYWRGPLVVRRNKVERVARPEIAAVAPRAAAYGAPGRPVGPGRGGGGLLPPGGKARRVKGACPAGVVSPPWKSTCRTLLVTGWNL